MDADKYRLLPLLAAILAAACSPQPRELEFPEVIGQWKRASAAAVSDIPEPVRRLGPRTARAAEYQGPGRMRVTVYHMASSAAALEAEQTWTPAADTVAFHRNDRFLTVHWENVDRPAVSGFIREIEKLAER
jgi:hypothetical protein